MHSPVSPTTDACSSSQGSPRCSTGTPNSPVSEPRTYSRTPPSPSEAAFICTICWQHQPSGAKPKLLGTSARIVCHACWRAVLDLSICWVCGECIVRGDEVVSLGWCFWHRGCFGCLICRTRMSAPRAEAGTNHAAEWGKWDGSGDGVEMWRSVGIELDTIPLCNVCSVETAAESQDQVLERGLESVTSFDGGLSRDRLDMLTELTEEREGEITLTRRLSTRNPRRLRGVTGIEQDLKRYINGSSGRFTNDLLNPEDLSSLLDNAADMGKTSDRTMDRKQGHTHRSMTSSDRFQEIEQPDAYVSVFDPVGEPASKPSKFKPLPSWMNLLPNNVHRGRQQKRQVVLEPGNQHSPEFDSSIEYREPSSSEGSEDFPCSPIALVDIPNLRGGGRATLPISNPNKSRKQRGKRTISFEPKYLANDTNDNEGHRCPRRLEATESGYTAPPEYPSHNPPPPRRRTPYPQDLPRLSTLRKDVNAYYPQSRSFDIAKEPTDEPCCELGSQLQQQKNVQGDRLLSERREWQASSEGFSPSMSPSPESLDKNLPKSSGVKKNLHSATTGEPILDKTKREKAGKQNAAKGTKDKPKNKRAHRGMEVAGEEYDIDARRENLQRELKRLFHKE